VEAATLTDVIVIEISLEEKKNRNNNNNGSPELLQFLRTLTPGTCLVIQYDCQPPTSATFQGFQGNNVIILSDFDCFPGLARIAINKINVVSVNSPDCSRFCCKRKNVEIAIITTVFVMMNMNSKN
jgi:hypothetical protein